MSDITVRLSRLAAKLTASTGYGRDAHTVLEAKAEIEGLRRALSRNPKIEAMDSKSQLTRKHVQRDGCQCDACMANVRNGLMPHASDCAVHNAPAMEPGPCDCGAAIE